MSLNFNGNCQLLIDKFNKAKADMAKIKKSAKNQHQKYTYATLDDIMSSIQPALTEHGLYMNQRPLFDPSWSMDYLYLETEVSAFNDESKEWERGYFVMPIPLGKHDPQGYGSAMTYARKYSALVLWNLPTKDDDGAAASKDDKPQKTVDMWKDDIEAAQDVNQLAQILKDAKNKGLNATGLNILQRHASNKKAMLSQSTAKGFVPPSPKVKKEDKPKPAGDNPPSDETAPYTDEEF